MALMCRNDRHHEWAKLQFSRYPGPFLTCEAVVAETCFLLARAGFDPARALLAIERDVVRVAMQLTDELGAVRSLLERYANVPASLADACLVRLSEIHDGSRVLTLDRDFSIYRRHGRRPIPLVAPSA
jgi:uncharacterized protein